MNVLLIHEILPQTDRSGSDLRLMQIVKEIQRQGHEMTYVARNGVEKERYAKQLEELGIKLWVHDGERLRYTGESWPGTWTMEEVLGEKFYDIAILYLWFWSGISVPEQYLQEVRHLSPATRIVVLTEDQHGLREKRGAQLSGLLSDYQRGEDFTSREIEVCRHADMTLVISEDDRKGLLALAPELEIVQVPMIAEVAPAGAPFHERDSVLFLGNFDNLGN